MPSQLVKLALIDPAAYIASGVESDLDVEKFSIYQDGALDASRQVISIEADTAVIENNRELITSKVYTLDVVGLYSQSKRAKLQGWSKNATPLYITGYGLDGSFLYAYGTITVIEGFDSNTSFKFRFQSASVGGYDPVTTTHSSGLIYSTNGTSYYKWQARPGNPNSLPYWYNGFNILGVEPLGSLDTGEELEAGSPAYSFADDGFRIQCDGTSRVWGYQSLFFPFDNVELKFTTYVSSYTQTGVTASKVSIFSYTDNFDANAENSQNANVTGTGDFTASITTLPGTNVVKVRHGVLEDTDIVVKRPRLNIGSVKPFTEFDT